MQDFQTNGREYLPISLATLQANEDKGFFEGKGDNTEQDAQKIKILTTRLSIIYCNKCSEKQCALRPNGFTEKRMINDFPIRNRKVVLHVRRRRWLDKEGHNVVLSQKSLTSKGISYSKGALLS